MARKFEKLTRSAIRDMKPGARITEHGITAEKMDDGDVKYSVNIMVRTRRVHRTIGRSSDGTTRTQAEEFIDQVRADERRDRLDLSDRSAPLTVSAALAKYIKAMEETDGKNLRAKRQHISQHLSTDWFGKMTLDRVAPFTMAKLRKHLREKKLSDATANRVAATWNHAAGWLTDPGGTESRPRAPIYGKPLPRMKKPKEENRRDFVFSDRDEAALIEAAADDIDAHIWLFAKLVFATSLRHAEALSARYDNLDTQARRLRVKVKGGKWRLQPVPQYMMDILADQREMMDDQDGWIFPNPYTKSGHVDALNKQWRRCAITAGLNPDHACPHAARHTAITRFSAAVDGDIAMIKEFSGHESLDMVIRYSHPSRSRIDAAMERVESRNVVSIGAKR